MENAKMYTWYAKVLLLSGEYIYVAIRNTSITDSGEIAKCYFTGEVNNVNAFNPANEEERAQVFIMLGKIQAFWLSDKPFKN